jgi:isopenicillin-N epimerase
MLPNLRQIQHSVSDGNAVTNKIQLLRHLKHIMNGPSTPPEQVADHASEWQIKPGLTYLNHGSFGLSPQVVNDRRDQLSAQLRANPMEFFVRQQESLLQQATGKLAEFVGCDQENLVILDNATAGMNVVASSFPLSAGDQVVVTNHAYGAVVRIWQRACDRAGAELVTVDIPFPPESDEVVIERIREACTPRTRLLVISHISSMTATILPVANICDQARQRGIATCIDGPHAVAQIPLAIAKLECDYYTASCHKWLCGPLGTGLLYTRTPDDPRLEPLIKSWGRLLPTMPETWREEFWWTGTRDIAAYLALPTAIELMQSAGLNEFRRTTHALALFASEKITQVTGLDPFLPDRDDWFGSMIPLPLPDCDPAWLMKELATRFKIEVPTYCWQDQPMIRVSCHLYNHAEQIEYLASSLAELLGSSAK